MNAALTLCILTRTQRRIKASLRSDINLGVADGKPILVKGFQLLTVRRLQRTVPDALIHFQSHFGFESYSALKNII